MEWAHTFRGDGALWGRREVATLRAGKPWGACGQATANKTSRQGGFGEPASR